MSASGLFPANPETEAYGTESFACRVRWPFDPETFNAFINSGGPGLARRVLPEDAPQPIISRPMGCQAPRPRVLPRRRRARQRLQPLQEASAWARFA